MSVTPHVILFSLSHRLFLYCQFFVTIFCSKQDVSRDGSVRSVQTGVITPSSSAGFSGLPFKSLLVPTIHFGGGGPFRNFVQRKLIKDDLI